MIGVLVLVLALALSSPARGEGGKTPLPALWSPLSPYVVSSQVLCGARCCSGPWRDVGKQSWRRMAAGGRSRQALWERV